MPKFAPLGGLVLALALTGAASAQTDATPAAPAASPAASAAAFKPGMVVKDPDGATVGSVVRAGTATNGQMAVVVNIDGKDVSLPATLFTLSGNTVNSSVTKAQIQAAAAKG